jgi:CubicO group peptidase (beta-lactamase class C family)
MRVCTRVALLTLVVLSSPFIAALSGAQEVGDPAPLPVARPESVGLSSERLRRIDRAMRTEIDEGRLPGAVVAIARKGRLVYYESFGFLDKAAGLPMPKDAIFSIASMTKPLTTVGALTLYEQGRVLLNDPVGKYLPQLDAMPVAVMRPDASGGLALATEPARRKPTLQDLMRHTAGLTNGDRGTNDLYKQYQALGIQRSTGPEFLDKLGKLALHFQPGTMWDYSMGLDVLGLVIESITHQSLGAYLQTALFQPLGMVDTGFVVPRDKATRIAKLLEVDPITGQKRTAVDRTVEPKLHCGGACAVSTAADYLRFAQMLLNKGVLDGPRILGPKTVEAMTSDQLGPEVNVQRLRDYPNLNGYGFGYSVAVRRGTGVAGIMGSEGDYNWGGANGTYFWVDPSQELAVVFMAAAPGELRLRNRQLITTLVLQAIEN